jgi:hypothetical protein
MSNKFQIIIDHFNSMEITKIFTSSDLKKKLPGMETSVNTFMDMVNKLGAIERDKIEKPGRGPRFYCMKTRHLTPTEVSGLTEYPACMDFKKKVIENYKKEQEKLAKRTKKVKRSPAKRKPEAKNVSASKGKIKVNIEIS